MKCDHHILNLGAGVQSTAVYLLACEGRLPIERAILADPQDEPAVVYAHLKWLMSLGGPPVLIHTAGRLGDDIINGRPGKTRFASIPAFVRVPGQAREGMIRRQCTAE